MSVAGLCEVCQTATVEDGCDRCGRVVCAKHYDRETGYCTDCRSDRDGTPGDDRTRPDGVDEFRF